MPLSNRLQAGKLRHRIQIVKASGTVDTFGGVPPDTSDWTVLHDAWAEIKTLNGRDMLVSDQFMTQVNMQLVIRFFPDVDASCRVWFNKRTFQITAVMNPDQRTHMLILNCVEINDSKQQPVTPAESTVS
jgi:SPP1 family predicted phage head-tail adaptor